MRIQDAYDVIPKDEERSYRVPYLQIQEMFDIGFYSTFEDGIDHHHVTRDITVSMQQFHDNELTNILFQQGNPLRIRLTEEDVAPYYSDYLEWRFILEGHFEMEIDRTVVCHFIAQIFLGKRLEDLAALVENAVVDNGKRFCGALAVSLESVFYHQSVALLVIADPDILVLPQFKSLDFCAGLFQELSCTGEGVGVREVFSL